MKERIETKQTAKTGWLVEAFAKNPHHYEDNRAVTLLKKQQFTQFLERGFPSRKEEAWKYNDLSFLDKTDYAWAELSSAALNLNSAVGKLLEDRAGDSHLLVFINGYFSPHLSRIENLPTGTMMGSLQEALQTHANMMAPYLLRELDSHRYPLASLNTALLSEGLFLYLPSNAVLEKPVHLLSIATQKTTFMMQPRHLVIMENGAHLTLTEEYLSDGADHYLTNAVTDLFVGRNADLNYYKLQNEAPKAKHFSTIFLHQKQNSRVNAASFAFGSQFARNDIFVTLREHHAHCRVNGFYGTDSDQQVLDHHLNIDHQAENTKSEMDFRGVLAKQSRAIFNGKVKVWPDAQKIVAQQYNHNILLSPQAEIYSKPDLEIYADEVQCRHGATVGQLDEEVLFYLCARGISRAEATVMLLQAFMDSILSHVSLPWLAVELHEQWGKRLASS